MPGWQFRCGNFLKIEKTKKRRLIRAYLDFAFKNQVAIVLVSLILAAIGVFLSLKIHLDPDLESLLPRNTETASLNSSPCSIFPLHILRTFSAN